MYVFSSRCHHIATMQCCYPLDHFVENHIHLGLQENHTTPELALVLVVLAFCSPLTWQHSRNLFRLIRIICDEGTCHQWHILHAHETHSHLSPLVKYHDSYTNRTHCTTLRAKCY